MLMLKIAARNLFRNTRRSVTTLGTITIGAAAVMVFGAYITYIQYGVQTNAVQQTGHLQVFRNGYFAFGTASPGAWGIDRYSTVLSLIRNDPTLRRLSAVVTPIQSVAGIAGNFENNTSKTFFGVGFVPSDRDRMKQWNEYGTEPRGLTHSGLNDDDLSRGITGRGLVRILGLCNRLHLDDCSQAPQPASSPSEFEGEDAPGRAANLADLASRDKPQGDAATNVNPTIDLLAATAGGAPNVVSLQVANVEIQPFKELDDNYVGMNIGLAQDLIYGRGEHKATGIVLQLHRTEDLGAARARLVSLFREHALDLEVRDFTDLNPQYNQIIGLFRSIFSFITLIIGIVVLFTVSNAMSMSVIERTAEIGTTRAMGVRRQGIREQFLVEGSVIGAIGATIGVFVAQLVAFGVNHAGLTWTPPGAGGPVPLRLYANGVDALVVLTWIGLLVVSAAAALIPANRAARMPVVDALRHV
ncbi:MAG TPA: FtsX-like permease family protein [Vicinamibacterales bacterium]|nr:FtsX-like permease family protein [Vicinamibacterales bacterium]